MKTISASPSPFLGQKTPSHPIRRSTAIIFTSRVLILDIIVGSTFRVILHLNLKLYLSNLQGWQAMSFGIVGSTDLAEQCHFTIRLGEGHHDILDFEGIYGVFHPIF
jgi:hypothetical protein